MLKHDNQFGMKKVRVRLVSTHSSGSEQAREVQAQKKAASS